MASPSPRLFVLLNHQLTPDQGRALSSELGAGEFFLFPPEFQELWRQIPPDLPELSPLLQPLREWLAGRARPGDYLLVQGDFGATFLMVQFAREQGLVPVYATTRRVSREEPQPDGSVRTSRRFEHRRFRKYGV